MNLLDKYKQALTAAAHIYTWTAKEELAWLAEHASQCKRVLEIGTYMGASAKVLAAAGAHVTCLDYCPTDGIEHVARQNLAAELASGQLTYIQRNAGVSAVHLHQAGHTFDMIWIDDGHTYADVVRDCLTVRLLAASGCFVCGHDYEVKPDGSPHNEVAMAVNDCFGRANVKRGPGSIWHL